MVIKGFRVAPLLKKTGQEILDDNVLGLAAQTAYYFFFSLFPLFLFATPLIGVFADKREVVNWLIGKLGSAVSPDQFKTVNDVIVSTVFSESAPGLMSIGALLAAWAGSNVFGSLMDALNRAYDVEETRPWWKRKLIALAAVAVTGLCTGIASAIMLAGPEIVKWLEGHSGLGGTFATVWMFVQYPLALSMLVGVLFMTYYFLPNIRQFKGQVLTGAIVATLLWVVATLAFRAYVVNFGSYNKTYGAIGGVIVLLTWMYYTMVVILIGGELNAELHHGTGALEPRRAVVYAGRLVTAPEPGKTSTDRVERVQPLRPRGA
ncbi:MAG: YihY/virulence factor BrkB family protein [Gemmatimonadaceae bacterium]